MSRPQKLNSRPPLSTLTPLGPGGGPFARWRTAVAILALCALVAVVALMLSARAPEVISQVSDRVATRIETRAPEASQAASQAVRRGGVHESDTLAHIGLWSSAALLVGLATWSWRSLTAAAALLLAASTGLELVQQSLSPTRITEWSDVAANLLGLGIGLGAVVALTTVSGLPARVRRWRHQRNPVRRGADDGSRPRRPASGR